LKDINSDNEIRENLMSSPEWFLERHSILLQIKNTHENQFQHSNW
jgi:hypothetical protein